MEYQYDLYGNITRITEHPQTGTNVVTEFEYTYNSNGTSNVATIKKGMKNADGQTLDDIIIIEQYDIMGRLVSQTDGNGGVTRYTYDNCDRILTETDPSGAVTAYQYNEIENYIILTDANGVKLKYQYDDLGNISQISREVNGVYVIEATYTYDNMCRVSSVTEYREGDAAKGIYTTFREYDALGRVIDETVKQGDIVVNSVQYTYDELSSNTLDFVTVQTTNTGSVTPATYKYSYDLRGLLKEEAVYNAKTR